MKKYLLLALFLLLQMLPQVGFAQYFEDLKIIGNTQDDKKLKIRKDQEGNFYMVGFIAKGAGKTFFGQIFDNSYGNFLAKFNKYGQRIWIKADLATYAINYQDFAIGPDGSIYITGSIGLNYFLLDKYDKNGNVVWKKRVGSDPFGYDYVGESITVDQQGNVYVVGQFDGHRLDGIVYPKEVYTSEKVSNDFIVKYDGQGKIIWAQSNFQKYLYYNKIEVDGAGNTIVTGSLEGKTRFGEYELESIPPTVENYGGSLVFMVKRNPAGQVLWAKGLPVGRYDFAIDGQDHIIFSAELASFKYPALKAIEGFSIPQPIGNVLLKLDPSGKALWLNHYTGNFSPIVAVTADAIYEHGSFNYKRIIGQDTLIASGETDNLLTKYDLAGKRLWTKQYGGPDRDGAGNMIYLEAQKKLVLTGAFSNEMVAGELRAKSRGAADVFLLQVSETPPIKLPLIKGKIFADKNFNCLPDGDESGMPGVLVQAFPGPFMGITDSLGNFSMETDTGAFHISPVLPGAKTTIMTPTCPEPQGVPVSVPEFNQVVKDINFGYQVKECALLTVDIAADRRRRCMRSKTTVTYSNEGTADAQNVRIKVLYPRYVVPIKSSLAWASKQDSVMVFDIGTLKAGERRSFVITDSTICGNEAIRGLSQCVKAIISPKSTCISPGFEWDQSRVVVEASLTEQDQVASFTIANQGQGDMSDSTAYRLYANEALVEQGKVKLARGARARLAVPDPRATLRLEADQSPNHPGMSRPVASIQPAMVSPAMAAPSPIDASYQDDADAEVSISCLPIIDSFDPNDKQVSPQGISRRHYIKAEDELEYLIRFQNTGTDTAYTVVVKDTLSAFVDVASLQIGSASHPFTYTVSGKGRPVLTFTFKNINLPDHKKNEPASHGYIKFRIGQAPGNPKGTVIRNLAYNYFDFNSPIATNEVFNIIGDTILAPPVPMVVYDCGKQMPTVALAGEEIRLCEAAETVLQANAPEHGLGRWRILSGQATLSDPTHPQSRLADIGYGEVVLEWSIRLCEVVSRSQVKVFRYAFPKAPVLAAPALQCEGSQLMPLWAEGSNITWYADADKQQKLYTGNGFIPQIQATTTFYASQTVNGCESPAASVEVKMHPARLSFSATRDTLVAPEADSYQWYFNGQQITGATGQKYLARNTGAYSLQTTTQGCVSTSSPVAIVKNQPQATLSLGPNPASGRLNLELAANATGEVSIVIRDRLGRELRSLKVSKPHTVLEQTLELGNIPSGLYLLEIQLGAQVFTRKFVQQ